MKTNNPPITSKGDRHGMPRVPVKAGMVPNAKPSYPKTKNVPYNGKDKV